MLLLFTSAITNRIRYITNLVIMDILGVEFKITTSAEEFSKHEGPKLCYAGEPVANALYIEASGLLTETKIFLHDVESAWIDGIPALFKTSDPRSAFRFDLFAASFYMVSRYEEYHPHKKDNFGRYMATESVASRGGFLLLPVVHMWALLLENALKQHFPDLKFLHRRYCYIPTIDIDHAWCYKGRTLSRTIGGIGRSVIHGHPAEIRERLKVLMGLAPDPYDNYEFIKGVHEPYGNFPLYFILFADYGINDNNVTVTSKAFHKLLRALDRHKTVGIHPSLSSNKHLLKLETEYDELSNVLNRPVMFSRQHFLKISLPRTYNTLIKLGITDDYSMGYASHPGFRAGIAIPFPFFDLVRDEATSLKIHPVTLMDVTMKDYLRLSRVESLEKISNMIQSIRSVNGEFVSLWHNESLGDHGRWMGWKNVYQEMVKLASV